jgi:hypothetical protein
MSSMRAFTSLATPARRALLSARTMRSIATYTTQAPNSTTPDAGNSTTKTHFGFRDVLESEKEQLGRLLA